MPLAYGQRTLDNLAAAKIYDCRLPQVHDQKDNGHQKGKGLRDAHLLRQERVGGMIEPFLLLRFTRKRLDHFESREVFLQDRIERRQALLHAHKERLRDRAKDHKDAERERQDRQNH